MILGTSESETGTRSEVGYEEEEDEWNTPYQENTEHRSSRCRHANADYQGSHSASHVKDELIIKALKAIANHQELPSKPPHGQNADFL